MPFLYRIRFYGILVALSLSCRLGLANDTIQNKRPTVGLVLSGGGAKGMAHVGVLKVLEEVGMPIDYIGGTSIGSIVGGLYSIGYTAKQLETYMAQTDWNNLLTDKILRKNIVIYEKNERKKYWLQFPLSKRKLKLPKGMLTGQNVSNLLTELASPAYCEQDFSRFRTPFLCVATDLKVAEEVLLEHGELPKAMRASMAIPSVFTPEEIDGKILFDGGLVNNFPADKIKEKNIDILIGVDVTTQHPDGSELDNMYQIAEYVVFMTSIPFKEANKKLCKIVIIPDVSEYKAASFNATDSLIVRGERAARQQYAALKALADSLNQLEAPPSVHTESAQPLSEFHVKEIQVSGLTSATPKYVLAKLGIEEDSDLTFAELNKAVERLKGTLIFASITYHLQPAPDDEQSVILHFTFMEQSTNHFSVGLHYDKEYQAALLLNLSFRNVLLDNSKTKINLAVGENPAFSLSYLQSPHFRLLGKEVPKVYRYPEWMFRFDAYQRSYDDYDGKQKVGRFDCSEITSGVQLQFTPTVNGILGLGVTGDYSFRRSRYTNARYVDNSSYTFVTGRVFYERDSYNEDYFPTAGSNFRVEGSYHDGISKAIRSEFFANVILRSNFAASPTGRWTIHSGVNAAATFGSSVAPTFQIYAGGFPDKLYRNEFRFTGINFMQKSGNNLVAVHFNHQIRLWSNIYTTIRTDFGKMEDEFLQLLEPVNFMLGYGLSVEYNSIVGPVGVTLSSSNVTQSLLAAFHLGFWF
ncbi:MAG: patatin-like phospholipase family protein [Bacteroidales bacterium]|jgi:NTE family protein|nr:patatin-like phospholipase family protein [Bacteroidales bacterium]